MEDKQSFVSSTSNSQTIINLKIGEKSEDFYKLVVCEKEKLNEYDYILNKIKNIINKPLINSFICIYSPNTDLKILNSNDWKNHLNFIFSSIDSKNCLKLKFAIYKKRSVSANSLLVSQNSSEISEKTIENKNFEETLNKNDLTLPILENTFRSILETKAIKDKIFQKIYEEINSDQNDYKDIILEEHFRKIFNKVLNKFKTLNSMKTMVDSEDEYIANSIGDEKEEIESFSKFYNISELSNFKSKLITESFNYK